MGLKIRGDNMTYKDISKRIEHYEKVHNRYKKAGNVQLFNDSLNDKEYALAAIYDFCRIYRYENEDEQVKETLNDHMEKLEQKDEFSEEQKRLNKIYLGILRNCISLEGKERLKIIEYGFQKKKEHQRKDEIKQKRENKKIVEGLSRRVNLDFKTYTHDKKMREEEFFHVGTSEEYRKNYINLLTKDEVEYILLSNAINDSLESKINNILINDEIVKACFKKIAPFPKEKNKYIDDNAYKLSDNGYGLYKDTFTDVYKLDESYRKKLVVKLIDRL